METVLAAVLGCGIGASIVAWRRRAPPPPPPPASTADLDHAVAELLDVKASLETLVQERSRRLAESNLRLAQENELRRRAQQALEGAKARAEETAHETTAFVASLAHEIRNPMQAVVGVADLLLGGALEDEQRGHVLTIARSAQGLVAMLDDALACARVDAGHVDLQPAPFDPRAAIQDVVALYAPVARQAGVAVAAQVHGDVPARVVGDGARLAQIASNLVQNALKFTTAGRVDVTLAADTHERGATLTLTVDDTGIGMSAEACARVFAPFAQATPETARRYGGTGLGLAICKRLAEAMGGAIHVSSVEGEGSTFTVAIPFARAVDEDETAKERASPGHRRARAALRVLVVEDDAVNRKVALKMLERLGHEAQAAADAEEALRKVDVFAFDVVLMDVHLPRMNGLEALAKLRERPSRPRVVMLTADALPRDDDGGADAWLAKPVTLSTLSTALARAA